MSVPDFKELMKKGNLSVKEIQQLVADLEEDKGFGRILYKKILWMGEEYGELVHAFKHNDHKKLVVECIDILFFVGSILGILDVDGDKEFIKKLKKNWGREATVKKGEFHFDKK